MLVAASLGMNVRVVTPAGYEPDPDIVERAIALGRGQRRTDRARRTTPWQACRGADAIYTDVWASMGQEAEAAERLAVFPPYAVTAELLGRRAATRS